MNIKNFQKELIGSTTNLMENYNLAGKTMIYF